ncbi:MAG: type II toxin-antitoxin system VapC family toxin [Micrococcales bacterium]|nr:type II toxin-antitoxin system VapC family toxin [Micrococcales bacterium]MCL2667797.1 type II toxin-antitoxin system VapC family toxin [Micrococcales bacterium]
MIVDTSAIVALLLDEPTAPAVDRALREADVVRMAAPTLVELGAVVEHRGPALRRGVDQLLELYRVQVEPFDVDQARLAREAYRDYGRGSGHRAHLNLGDVFAYALAARLHEPLLFVGDDFTHTDVVPALR